MPEDPPPDAEAITITRVFDAPRELVFRAWTEPERLVFTITDQPEGEQEVVTVVLTDLGDDKTEMVFHPIVLGTGKRLFGDGGKVSTLRLVDTRPVGPDGVLVLTYEPARTAGG